MAPRVLTVPGLRYFQRAPLKTGIIGALGKRNIRDHQVLSGQVPYNRTSRWKFTITSATTAFALAFKYETQFQRTYVLSDGTVEEGTPQTKIAGYNLIYSDEDLSKLFDPSNLGPRGAVIYTQLTPR